MSAGPNRFASVGVAQVGTNLTEQIVTSGKWSKWYKALPGATVDGINENGVVAEINVVDGDPQTSGWHNDTGDLHPLAAIRWILDNATNAQHAAEYIASHIAFPAGWTQNFHYMIADEHETWIVENGTAYQVTNGVPAMTNFRLYGDPKDTTGEGQERYVALTNGANITSQWWTLTYTANGYRASDLPGITGEALTQLFNYWENNPRESHRGESFGDKVWWQTVHTSVYDITNRTLRVAVQEQDDWYVFQVPSSGGSVDAYTKAETDALLAGYVPTSRKINGVPLTDDITVQGMPSTGLVWNATERAVKTADGVTKTIGAEDVGAVSASGGTYNKEFTFRSCNVQSCNVETFLIDPLSGAIGFGIPGLPPASYVSLNGSNNRWDFNIADHTEPSGFRNLGPLATLGDIPAPYMPSATDPNFSNAVATVARTVTPPPSPTLRVYDEVRQCYWLGKMVNGVIQWEVE